MSYGFMIEMHDLIQEMDREIIHQESIKDPKRWSQSWKHDECLMHVLKYNRVNGMCNYVYLILLISFLNVASMVAFVNYYSFFFVFQGTNVVENVRERKKEKKKKNRYQKGIVLSYDWDESCHVTVCL